ncbi:MAG: UDP-N-acetylglucosamine 1-carboxyvinyltransferase [Thermacetogeniaceae bacterium]
MKLVIQGGNMLRGRVRVSGAKNAALLLIAASAIVRGEVILDNVPRIADVETQLEIVRALGGHAEWQEANRVLLNWPDQIEAAVPYRLAKKLRASNLFLGALAARIGQARVPLPGGCDIGSRPMDLHVKGLNALGFDVVLEHGYIDARARELRGGRIYLDFPSVGATENIMMAAAGIPGTTVVENAAKEPEIVDLASFLNAAGATIRGAGTDLIKIEGREPGARRAPSGRGPDTRFSVIPDRIEAGTYMIAAAAMGTEVTIENVISRHLQPVIAKLQDMGLDVVVDEDSLTVRRNGPLRATDIKTFPYPGFPTDLQSPIMVLLCLAAGTGVISENVFDNRFRVADELKRMGAQIRVKGHAAVVEGPVRLLGAQVKATDLRAGAALVVAGLVAEGETEICQAELIERGYEKVVEKFSALGARLKCVD